MAIVGYVDFTTIGIVLAVQFILNGWARATKDDEGWIPYNIGAGVVGLFTMAWAFNDGYITFGFNTTNSTFIHVDPNVMVSVLSVTTILSFLEVIIRQRSHRTRQND